LTIFGKDPADIAGALFKSKNLSDVVDKAAARTNLQVPSITDVQYNSVPVGMIMPFWGTVAPAGYLPCSGQTVNSTTFPDLVTFLGGTTSATVPDLRGEFLRGWDNGRGLDVGRTISSVQTDAIQRILGSYNGYGFTGIATAGTLSGPFTAAGQTAGIYPTPTGGTAGTAVTTLQFDSSATIRSSTETRPHNVAVLYCIKAYSSVANYVASLNLSGLVSDYSNLLSGAAKYSDFNGANQQKSQQGWQKLPGGLILQWGTLAVGTTDTAFTLPLAPPTGILSITAAVYIAGTATSAGTAMIRLDSPTASTGSIGTYVGGSRSAQAVYWQAICY
jgi:microcystin-dependent protein